MNFLLFLEILVLRAFFRLGDVKTTYSTTNTKIFFLLNPPTVFRFWNPTFGQRAFFQKLFIILPHKFYSPMFWWYTMLGVLEFNKEYDILTKKRDYNSFARNVGS